MSCFAAAALVLFLCTISSAQVNNAPSVGFGDGIPSERSVGDRFGENTATRVTGGLPVVRNERPQIPAIRSEGMMTNIYGLARRGGPMFIPLAICSFLLFLFVFERSISLRGGRVIPKPFVRRFIEQLQEGTLDSRGALDRCEENGSPIAEVFAAGVKKWDRSTVEVEQAVIDAGERVAARLRKYLRLFNGIATISPLLGLLGTVMGMIKAFNTIATADAMGKPELLATGISQALLTTAAGLTVAIPAIIAYLHFSSRVDRLLTEIDQYGQQVVNEIAVDGWKERPKKKVKTRTAA